MLKKVVIGSAVALLVGTFVFGRDFVSYMHTGAHKVRDAVKSEVPLEFEVQRAREMVENLVPDIRHCMHVIAEQQVDLEQLEEKIVKSDQELGRQQRVILSLRDDLKSGRDVFAYASHSYTKGEVERDVKLRFERYQVAEDTLKRDRQILQAREKSLFANQEKLENMLAAKQVLEVQLEQLEARLKTIQAAETTSEIQLDQSQLARAKTLIGELNKQLDVREKVLDAEGKFTGLIPIEAEETPQQSIGEQIDAYFGTEAETQPDVKLAEIDAAG